MRYFQWVVGERRGEIVIFDKIIQEDDMSFIEFKDASRVNTDLVAEINETELSGKMVAEVQNPNNVWRFEEEKKIEEGPRVEQDWESQTKYEIPTADEIATADLTGSGGSVKPVAKKKKIKLIPPRPTRNKFGKIANTEDLAAHYNDTITPTPQVAQPSPLSPSVNTSDPVYIMLDKAKKVDSEVDMSLTIQLPSKALFDVVKDSFDEGSSKALEYIIENIDISDIKKALKEGIASMYDVDVEEKVEVDLSQFKGPGVPVIEIDNTKTKTGNDVFSANIEVDMPKEVQTIPGGAVDLFEPECVEEPIIKDAIPGDIIEEASEALKEK